MQKTVIFSSGLKSFLQAYQIARELGLSRFDPHFASDRINQNTINWSHRTSLILKIAASALIHTAALLFAESASSKTIAQSPIEFDDTETMSSPAQASQIDPIVSRQKAKLAKTLEKSRKRLATKESCNAAKMEKSEHKQSSLDKAEADRVARSKSTESSRSALRLVDAAPLPWIHSTKPVETFRSPSPPSPPLKVAPATTKLPNQPTQSLSPQSSITQKASTAQIKKLTPQPLTSLKKASTETTTSFAVSGLIVSQSSSKDLAKATNAWTTPLALSPSIPSSPSLPSKPQSLPSRPSQSTLNPVPRSPVMHLGSRKDSAVVRSTGSLQEFTAISSYGRGNEATFINRKESVTFN